MEQNAQEVSTEDARRLLWMKRVRRILRFILRYEIIGHENLPKESVVIASNHRSLWDPFFLFVVDDRFIVFVAANGVFKIPFLGRLMDWMGCIRAYRHAGKSPEARKKTLDSTADAVRQRDRTVCIYPEGGIVKKRKLKKEPYRITRGVGELQTNYGCIVVPVVLVGVRYWLFRFWRRVEITVYPPLAPNLNGEQIARELSDHFQNT